MKARWLINIPLLFLLGFLTACGSETQASSSGGNTYKDTKSMVLDILKTEDGRKAIQEATITQNTKMQLLSAGDTQQLQLAVKDVLVDTQNTQFLQKMITDPRFAGQFAKAVEKNTKQIHKDLLKDPEYQKSMMEAMKSPDYQTILMDTMKSTPYRTQMKTVIQESLQSPLFRLELMDLMKKVLQEESMPKEKAEKGGGGKGGGDQKQGGGKQSGGSGGDQGSDSGGS